LIAFDGALIKTSSQQILGFQMRKKNVADKIMVTREWVIEKLAENVERAMEPVAVVDRRGMPTGEYRHEGSVADKALELLGKELGMFRDGKSSDDAETSEISDAVKKWQAMTPVERLRRVGTMFLDAGYELRERQARGPSGSAPTAKDNSDTSLPNDYEMELRIGDRRSAGIEGPRSGEAKQRSSSFPRPAARCLAPGPAPRGRRRSGHMCSRE
jgi:hypothetical protein